jgi:hypothetical protein
MRQHRRFPLIWLLPSIICCGALHAFARGPLDPKGQIHMPIGVPDSLDTLKTFVEPEGCFSPGFATYGIYFWLYDHEAKRLIAATKDGVFHYGLGPGVLMPSTMVSAGNLIMFSQVYATKQASPKGDIYLVGATANLTYRGEGDRKVSLFAALRPLGPAGGDVKSIRVSASDGAILVDGHTALVANVPATQAGAVETDTIGDWAMRGELPEAQSATSEKGDCSAALRFDITLTSSPQGRSIQFVCPVLAGRRAVGHKWDGKNPWAQLDEAQPNPAQGGVLIPDLGLEYYRRIDGLKLFNETTAFWQSFLNNRFSDSLPGEWKQPLAIIASHAAMTMNEGAPDVAVVNYNVFNRDGVYMASIFQKIGRFDFSEKAIDYFLKHPFNGRIYPEADNPGQVLWIMGEHWQFTRDRKWLGRVYPSAMKLASMIRYYRTTPGPHWVNAASLDFGDALPEAMRQELKPGRCDGTHPEYTEAFDIAGLRAAALLAQAMNRENEAREWIALAMRLHEQYDRKFGDRLEKEYGSYSVLWPCRLYPFSEGKAHETFRNVGAQEPSGWRYFPLATAHQSLLAGNREAAYKTIAEHLAHEQIRSWYLFDEGGKSGAGGWRFARTTWNGDVAMPHGWAIAELWLLMRDSLVHEDGDRLVLLAGVPPEWFKSDRAIEFRDWPTHFGKCTFRLDPKTKTLQIQGVTPPGGCLLRLPPDVNISISGMHKRQPNGDIVLDPGEYKLGGNDAEARP